MGQLAAEAKAALVFYFVDDNDDDEESKLLTWVVTAATAQADAQLRFRSSPLPAGLGAAGLGGLAGAARVPFGRATQ